MDSCQTLMHERPKCVHVVVQEVRSLIGILWIIALNCFIDDIKHTKGKNVGTISLAPLNEIGLNFLT